MSTPKTKPASRETTAVALPAGAVPPRKLHLAKVVMYFVLFGVGIRILQEIFKELSDAEWFGALTKFSHMAAQTLDVTRNVDDLTVTFFSLTITFLLILPIAWVHMTTKKEDSDPSLTQTLIVLSVIVAGVMQLLQDNLARSFGLVGVVAAVRYRNTLKNPKDAVYIFLSLGVGMACGLQMYHVGLFLSFFECAILLVLAVYQTGTAPAADATLLQHLRDSEKKGERSPAEALAWLTPEARSDLVADLQEQSRYITTAGMLAKKNGQKRPNALIAVETVAGSGAARDHINAELHQHRGQWQLLGTREKGDVTVLEYLGRLSRKRSPPLKLLERLRHADADVRHVGFRSLRKMMADHLELDAANDQELGFDELPATDGALKLADVAPPAAVKKNEEKTV